MAFRAKLRHESESSLLGAPCELSERVLPTYKDVLKYVLFEREKESNINKSHPSIKEIVKVVTEKLIRIWNSASIPCVSIAAVKKRILNYYAEYQNLMKSIKSRKNVPSFKNKCDDFKKNAEIQLFDISACKCEKFENCTCSKEMKVPQLEQVFLRDQRTLRKMAIGNVDELVSKKNLQRAVRQNREHLSSQPSSSTDKLELISNSSSSESESYVEGEEEDYPIPASIKRKEGSKSLRPKTPAKRIKLFQFALACDRTGVSDRAAALLTSSIISDLTPINKDEETSRVVDRSKEAYPDQILPNELNTDYLQPEDIKQEAPIWQTKTEVDLPEMEFKEEPINDPLGDPLSQSAPLNFIDFCSVKTEPTEF